MTKAQQALMEVAAPFQKRLEEFLAKGGTAQEFAIRYPFATGVLYGVNSAAIKLL